MSVSLNSGISTEGPDHNSYAPSHFDTHFLYRHRQIVNWSDVSEKVVKLSIPSVQLRLPKNSASTGKIATAIYRSEGLSPMANFTVPLKQPIVHVYLVCLTLKQLFKDHRQRIPRFVIRRYLEKSILKKLFCHLQSLQIKTIFQEKKRL